MDLVVRERHIVIADPRVYEDSSMPVNPRHNSMQAALRVGRNGQCILAQGLGTFITVNLNWEFSTDMADLRHVMSIPFFITRIGWPVRKETSDARRLPFVEQNRLSFLSISPRPSLRDTPQGLPTQQRSQHRQFVTAQPDCSIKTPYDKVLIIKTRAPSSCHLNPDTLRHTSIGSHIP
jgi:hypothetical protein